MSNYEIKEEFKSIYDIIPKFIAFLSICCLSFWFSRQSQVSRRVINMSDMFCFVSKHKFDI